MDELKEQSQQNANVLIAMVLGAGQFYLIYLLVNRILAAGAGDLWLYGSVFLSALVLGLASYLVMIRLADGRYRDIQV